MKSPVQRKIGPFKTLTVDGRLDTSCVVLFHGYGADATDLVPLSEMMNLSEDISWIFPEAPLEIIIAPGYSGKAWFQIDSRKIEQALMVGQTYDMSQSVPDGFSSVRSSAQIFLGELQKKYKKIILGGFSQGAMLATEMAISSDKKPNGLIILSGTLINKTEWQKKVQSCAGLPFIQSHGKNDAILGYPYAEQLYTFLEDGGLTGEFLGFGGGHEIPPKIIEKVGQFIKQQLR